MLKPEVKARLQAQIDALKKRMQGKSCFNFDTIEPPLMTELSGLVKQGANRYKAAGKL